VAKTPGAEGCKIGVLEQGGKIAFTGDLSGPWGLNWMFFHDIGLKSEI
jgi:hypothetical protein